MTMNNPLTTATPDPTVDDRGLAARALALTTVLREPLPVSPHEGYAFIVERLDDLKAVTFGRDTVRARQEAIRVAAAAMRLMLTLSPHLGVDEVSSAVLRELRRATSLFGPMASPHEGWAVIAEEVAELWEAIRAKGPAVGQNIWDEAVQVAAMGLRFHADIHPGGDA
jgi:hypothetical protein